MWTVAADISFPSFLSIRGCTPKEVFDLLLGLASYLPLQFWLKNYIFAPIYNTMCNENRNILSPDA